MKETVSFLIFLLTLFLFQAASDVVASEEKNARLMQSDAPIEIVSDRLDAYSDKRLVVFSGNAVATQGARVIKADRLLLYYRSNPEGSKMVESKPLRRKGDLERVEAQGHVLVREGDRTVTGNVAVFYQDAQKIIMTGNAVMREGDNIIRGETIVVFLNESRGVVESSSGKRVTATIYPKEAKERNK